MTKKVLFFTAGDTATSDELIAIGKLQAAAPAPYDIRVRNGAHGSVNYGHGPEAADYVAGTPPAAYANTGTYPRIDPSAIPVGNLLPTQAVVANAQVITLGGHTFTFTVAANVITAIAYV